MKIWRVMRVVVERLCIGMMSRQVACMTYGLKSMEVWELGDC